jgi:RNA polymerase sigma factor (sigma-70 family)
MAELSQRHIGAQRRSVTREQREDLGVSDESVMQLANRLVTNHSSPSKQVLRHESQQQVRSALSRLPFRDREVLLLQFVEQLSTEETATVLGVRAEAVGMRRVRALQHLAKELGKEQP